MAPCAPTRSGTGIFIRAPRTARNDRGRDGLRRPCGPRTSVGMRFSSSGAAVYICADAGQPGEITRPQGGTHCPSRAVSRAQCQPNPNGSSIDQLLGRSDQSLARRQT